MTVLRRGTRSVGIAACLLAAACAMPRGGPAGGNNVCAAVLPAARAVVHERGRLVLVRPTRRQELVELFGAQVPTAPGGRPTGSVPPTAGPTPSRSVAQARACLIVYDGPYPAGVVGTSPAGRYATIGISVRPVEVLGARTTDDRPPGQLPHRSPRPPSAPSRTPAPRNTARATSASPPPPLVSVPLTRSWSTR
jgi:hypothetical protein